MKKIEDAGRNELTGRQRGYYMDAFGRVWLASDEYDPVRYLSREKTEKYRDLRCD